MIHVHSTERQWWLRIKSMEEQHHITENRRHIHTELTHMYAHVQSCMYEGYLISLAILILGHCES